MPDQETLERAREDAREGKSPSTQAGEFVREEIEHVREGKHGVRSTKQAIAIGLSKARRAGVDLPPPAKGTTTEKMTTVATTTEGTGAVTGIMTEVSTSLVARPILPLVLVPTRDASPETITTEEGGEG